MDIHTAHGVDDDLVGMCGKIILRLTVIIFGGDHRFAGNLEGIKRLTDDLQLVQPGIVQVF
ncbi:MAG: hypothetical protein ACD_75C01070G0001 [uncultured bacterium]|nr:MAG: hypothetical protein ACD_75C01070G0001 [uncultured bacterium]